MLWGRLRQGLHRSSESRRRQQRTDHQQQSGDGRYQMTPSGHRCLMFPPVQRMLLRHRPLQLAALNVAHATYMTYNRQGLSQAAQRSISTGWQAPAFYHIWGVLSKESAQRRCSHVTRQGWLALL
jgi:hypothetical protein